jgi:hypothetical protein
MSPLARTVAVAACAAIAGVATAAAVARMLDYSIYDVDGRLYLYAATPIAAAVLGSVLGRLPPRSWSSLRRTIAAVAGTVLVCAPAHWANIRAGWVGGGYSLPAGFDPERLDTGALEREAWSANRSVAHLAVDELVRRGPSASDALWRFIEQARRRYGSSYLVDTRTNQAVLALADLRDARVVPILKDMACDVSGAQTSYERQSAVNLLKNEYGLETECRP